MKKEFIKKLSFAMASAMVVATATPAANVEAAASMKMNKSSKILYLNDDNMTGTSNVVDLSIKNKPSNYKTKYSFSWYAEDTSIVSVAKGGVVTAKKVGQTTVKCDIVKKSTKKLVSTAKCVVTVKANADTVVISNAPENNKMAVGSTFDFNRTMKDANGKKATDKTEWIISDPEVASVEQGTGVVTALKAGEFTIKAATYQSKATKDLGYTAESEEIKITVAPSITKVAQTKKDTFEVEFDTDMSKLTASDFDITNASSVRQLAKKVTFDATGKKATVELFVPLTDKADYTVKVKDLDALTFTASVGEAAKVIITTTKVSDNVATETINYKIVDANGIELYAGDSLNPGLNNGDSIVFKTTDSSKGYFDGNKLIAFKIGDVIPVTVTYYTGKVNTTTGELIKVESESTGITVVDNAGSTIASVAATTVTDIKLGKNADWANPTTTVSVSDVNGNKAGTDVKYLQVKAIKTDGSTVYSNVNDVNDGFKFTSADTSKLSIDAETGELIPVAVGTANVIIKNGDFSYVTTVTVGAARTAATVAINKTTMSLSNNVAGSDTFELQIKDNYGSAMKLNNCDFERISAPKSATGVTVSKKVNGNKAEFTVAVDTDATVGTYTYKLTAQDYNGAERTYSVTVVVREGQTRSYYKVSGATSKELTIQPWELGKDFEADTLSYEVVGVDSSNLVVEKGKGVTFKVVKPNGATIDLSKVVDDANFKQVGNKLVVQPYTVTGGVVSKIQTGDYRIQATCIDEKGKENTAASTVLSITDKQAKASLEFKKNSLTITTGDDLIAALVAESNEIFKSDNGEVAGINELTISSSAKYEDGKVGVVGTYQVTVKKVVVNYEIKNNDDVTVAKTPQEISGIYTVTVTVQ